jgi:hypothetical protein
MSKHLLLLLLPLSRILDGTESGENLVSEAVRVVVGDTVAPVAGMDLLLEGRSREVDASTNSTSEI